MSDPFDAEDISIPELPDEEYTRIPEGIYWVSIGYEEDDLKIETIETKNGPAMVLRIRYEVEVPEDIRRECNLREDEKIFARTAQTIWLDTEIGPNGKPILAHGPNRNVNLGRILRAFGIGKGGTISQLRGKRTKGVVEHQVDTRDREKPREDQRIYTVVSRLIKA